MVSCPMIGGNGMNFFYINFIFIGMILTLTVLGVSFIINKNINNNRK